MNWLSGKPQRVIPLLWPENHPLDPYGPWSVLDDQVLHTFTVRDPDQQSSAIYLAKLYEIAQAGQGTTTAAFVKIATLPNAVHRVALLPDRAGFISLEFTREQVLSLAHAFVARAHLNNPEHRASCCAFIIGMVLSRRKSTPTQPQPMATSL